MNFLYSLAIVALIIFARDSAADELMPSAHFKVRIVGGLYAPVDGTTSPVLLDCVDTGCSDFFKVPNRAVKIIAAARVSAEKTRVNISITSISMRLSNGEIVSLGAKGRIVEHELENSIKATPIDTATHEFTRLPGTDPEVEKRAYRKMRESVPPTHLTVESGRMLLAIITALDNPKKRS